MKIRVKTHKRSGDHGARRDAPWVATATLAAYTLVGSRMAAPAYAQEGVGARDREGAPAQGQLPVRRFDLPAGPLGKALDAFAQASGLQISLSTPAIRDLSSSAVTGVYTAEQALRRLLEGTHVSYRFPRPGVAALDLALTATSVDVTASVAAVPSSPKYTEPLRDTPQSISVVPQEVLEEQGATTLRDALRNVAGISLAAGEGGAQGDNLTIRGFTARNDLFIDGMRDFGSYYRDPFNTQEVEVLQGPSSVTFGRGSTGGVVNQQTKTPHLGRSLVGDVDLGTDLTRRLVLDLDTPVPALGPHAAFRLNLMGHESDVAQRDVAENRRFGIAPSLALGLSTATRWTFTYLHQTAHDVPDYGVPWLFDRPAPVDRTSYYGFADGNYLRTNDDIGTARIEHDFSDRLTVRNQARYASYDRDALITEAQILTPTLSAPFDALTVSRKQIGVKSVESFLDDQLDLRANVTTGPVRHAIVAGLEVARETSAPRRPTYTGVPTTSLLDPNPDDAFAGTATITSDVNAVASSVAGYALDTVKLGGRWEITGGLRWDRFDTSYDQSIAPVASFDRVDDLTTWRAAAVYKPRPSGSFYVAAGTSFNPSAEALSLSAANADLPPEKNRTYEVGSKWDLSGGKLSIRGALFRTDKTNAREPDPVNPLLNVLAGSQRVNGVQLETRGRLTSRWELLAGYAYMDGTVVSSTFFPAAVGAQLANVPKNTFNFWTTLALPGKWEVAGGGNYVSRRTASSTVPLDPTTHLAKALPGYWVFNAMVRRPLNARLSLQLNVNNLADAYYFDQLHPAHIVPGPGRTALLDLKFQF